MKNTGGFRESFGCALSGIAHCIAKERHFRFHLFAAAAAILFSLLLRLTPVELAVIVLVCGAVITAEAINTAIENTVDLCTGERHPLAKTAKDAAAGAVLVISAAAALIGMIIWIPHILLLFH